MLIRKCTKDDFNQLLQLLEQLWPDQSIDKPRLQQVFLHGLSCDYRAYFCIELESSLIAFVSLTVKTTLWPQGPIGQIDELVVDQQHRRSRIGTRLLRHITEIAKQKGCRTLELDSALHRKQAHKFYQHHNFENKAFLLSKTI